MNSRTRVISAIEMHGPDRAPIMHRTLPGAFKRYGNKLEELYARYPSDVLLSPSSRAPFSFSDPRFDSDELGKATDPWGCLWQATTDEYLGLVVGYPLANWDALDDYQFPDPANGIEGVQEMIECVRADDRQHYVLVTGGTLMHRLTFLHGFSETLIDLALGSEEMLFVRDKVVEYLLKQIEIWLETGLVDGILIEDDWGTQQALFLRPDMWRKLFKPCYRKLVDAIHAGGARAHLHSDGNTREIIPDFIEIGFDELNPQVWAMDVEELSTSFSGKVCFRADLDRQHILPHGTPAEVAEHVRRTYEAFGNQQGGYIGYGQIGPDVSLANAEAMLRTSSELV